MRLFFVVCFAVSMSAPAMAASVAPTVGAALESHRATYKLSLARLAKGDGVRAAKGGLTYSLTDQCEGYTIESTLTLETAFASGIDEHIEQRFAAWEAKDGRHATFQMQNFEDGKLTKMYRGTVRLDESLAGTATFESDSTSTFQLPPGTLLSTAHTLALLKSAAAGEQFVSRVVIDGSFESGPFRATAAIGPARDAPPKKGISIPQIAIGASWPMEVAYFPLDVEKDLPDYEIDMQMLGNGVTRSMTQDFGNFAIGFELSNVEPLPAQACN